MIMISSFSILGIDVFGRQRFRGAIRSPKWKSIRLKHLQQHPCCAACGRSLKVEVHHIEPVHINPERELDLSNLITLCADPCHILFGHFMDWKSWNKDVVNDCGVYYDKYKNRPHKS